MTTISLGARSPARSSNLPGSETGRADPPPLLGLAPCGVCQASRSPGCWWALTLSGKPPHHFTLTGRPESRLAVSFLLHCPDPSADGNASDPIRLRVVGVTHHIALWSPDFPPPGGRGFPHAPGSGRPADPVNLHPSGPGPLPPANPPGFTGFPLECPNHACVRSHPPHRCQPRRSPRGGRHAG